jgi:hypothetical protein
MYKSKDGPGPQRFQLLSIARAHLAFADRPSIDIGVTGPVPLGEAFAVLHLGE